MIYRIELYGNPDSRGRYHYALFWMASYHPGHPDGEYRYAERGQHFFGIPPCAALGKRGKEGK